MERGVYPGNPAAIQAIIEASVSETINDYLRTSRLAASEKRTDKQLRIVIDKLVFAWDELEAEREAGIGSSSYFLAVGRYFGMRFLVVELGFFVKENFRELGEEV